jgi:hypothetical protein
MALFGKDVSGVLYPDQDGHCPYKAGELPSNVKDTLNAHRLTGRWINVFDREHLNDEHKCYGVKLMHTHDYDDQNIRVEDEEGMKDVPKLFEYLKATNVGESRDPNDYESWNEDVDIERADLDGETMVAFGYHIFNGF